MADRHHDDGSIPKDDKREADMIVEDDLDEKYPNRPRNSKKTLPFHELYTTLFNPLSENRKKPAGPVVSRKKQGPHGPTTLTPHEARQQIIERFIARWRKEVGNDIYPAFRLIIPDKDRERPMYGLKENTIAKLLIDVMKITKQSEDGNNLLNWKQPGNTTISRMAGDFASRCHEVISKRPMRTKPGNMTIEEVNDRLDNLANVSKKDRQIPIFTEFYNRMNADEMIWLIRIILRQMKVGATEKTFFHLWHPDAESLFNISTNLRRICWELYDPRVRLESEDTGVTLMQCFQPQLAQFQMRTFQMVVNRMRPTEEDAKFWIEEKLDGERMQLHMISDEAIAGGKRFCFWSRKAKDYTYLYGSGFEDDNSALTRHLRDAFHQGVKNLILDGEMITWDPEQDAMVPFGSLKTAANIQQANPFSQGWRPFYKVFDILYLNDQVLTSYTLRDRRNALQSAVVNVSRRMEIHPYTEAENVSEVESLLRQVIAESTEGLVLKNPRSAYRLNDRNDDWIKVKPEYLTEYGENLDCCIIGGYYGSGKRGGFLSSYLCGLRVDTGHIEKGANPMKFYSFFKVGGGFTAEDYAAVRHQTDGKWKKWDPKRPPTEFVELAGHDMQTERPDEWIMPSDSIVIEVKAASVAVSESFKMGFTLRFPRFKKIRNDRKWDSALSISEFMSLRKEVEEKQKQNQMKVDDSRKKRQPTSRKKRMTVAGGTTTFSSPYAAPESNIFRGLNIYVMTGSQNPQKKSKAELEQLVKLHGGSLHQTESKPGVICVAENRTVHVASAIKRGKVDIVRPLWLFDNIIQQERDQAQSPLVVPFEPRHMLFTTEKSESSIQDSVDANGDSYARDVTGDELKELFLRWSSKLNMEDQEVVDVRAQLEDSDKNDESLRGWMFKGLMFHIPKDVTPKEHMLDYGDSEQQFRLLQALNIARFAGAKMSEVLEDGVTHVLVSEDYPNTKTLRREISQLPRLPRLVTLSWLDRCWAEKTRLDEEAFAPSGHGAG